jgi:pimeloyl-ACP methyl ester carboxylesterase
MDDRDPLSAAMNKFGKMIFILVIVSILVVAVVPLLMIIPPLEETLPPEQLADPDSKFIDVNGLKVHYKEFGKGKPGEPALILLHGFASSTYTWREVQTALAQNRRVVVFDRPAFGLTERPMEWEGPSPYSSEAQADLTIGLMDALGIEKGILVGNSAGGTIAALTALRHPERVEGLVLVDPAIYQGGRPAWFGWLANTPQMQRLGPLAARSIQKLGRQFAEAAWHDPAGITDEIWANYTKPLKAENWDRALWYLTQASGPTGLDEQLDRLQIPTLVLSGDDDRIVPTEQSVRLADELPNAELRVFPSCGHVPQEECPGPFLQAVEDFLAER